MNTPGQKRSRPTSSDDRNPRPQKRQYEKLRDARKIAVQSASPGIFFFKSVMTDFQHWRLDQLTLMLSQHPGPLK
jgi:hypothetical protein